jgi:glycosyltransferase involved in cell wall biosynthesis
MVAEGAAGSVSIVLPTHNRARFLPEAFDSILRQTHRDWELIVVDDGSTDETQAILPQLAGASPSPVRIVRQANAGAYAARNTGLDHANCDYVAFFDSDDLWLPHHLADCVRALARHEELDWVFGSCRMVAMDTGAEIEPTTFYVNGHPRPFLSLHTRSDGRLRLIDDPRATVMQIGHGLYCGLQNSVIRKSVFLERRFWPDYRVVEDELFVIRLLAGGGRFAYFDSPHVIYRVHGENSSGSAAGFDPSRIIAIFEELVRGLERVQRETALTADARRALGRRLARERFWSLGYAGYWQSGNARAARACYRKALVEWPWSPRMWKTFGASLVRRADPRDQQDPTRQGSRDAH